MDFCILDEQRRLARIFAFGVMAVFAFFLLLGRLFYMQVIEGDKYHSLAQKNRINIKFSPPSRGEILDKGGRPLAANVKDYRLALIPRYVRDITKSLEVLSLESLEQKRILQAYQRLGKRSMTPILVQKHLELENLLKLELLFVENIGGEIIQSASRKYPLKEAGAHVLGYVGAPSKDREAYLAKLGRVSVGKTGLEFFYDDTLFGKPGMDEIENNAAGQLIRVLDKRESIPGNILKTTLNADLQLFIYNLLLEHKSACAVVMDVKTGDILALVSYPSFDPHIFEDGVSESQWKELLNDPYRPLTNKAVSGIYAPGSSFKMIVALAALEAGIDPHATHFCSGGINVGNHIFHCHKPCGHGPMDMKSAICESCDVYFYELAQKVGIDRISKMAQKFGLGEKTSLNFPAERSGLVPSKQWKMDVKQESWKLYDTILSSIGQGYVLSTPLQLAQMTARLATGKMVTPEILQKENVVFQDLNVANLKVIQDAMEAVVNHPFGTGYFSRLEGVKYSGKTATSQVKRISMQERSLNLHRTGNHAWKDKDHAIFTGYGPSENPQYAVVVLVEHGGSGSKAAAPIAKEIFKKLLE